MYKITETLAKFLIDQVRDPGFKKNSLDPFKQVHNNSIGVIDPTGCFGTDFDYIIEGDFSVDDGISSYKPEVEGFWLYRKSELGSPESTVKIPQAMVDLNVVDKDKMLDVTDCSVTTPSVVDKLTCKSTSYLDKLLEWEPGLKVCLRDGLEVPKELQAPNRKT